MLIYALLEQAIITRAKHAELAGMLGYKWAHCDSYGGEFDQDVFWGEFRRFPALWVTVGGDDAQRVGSRDVVCTIKGAVMVGARSPRGERMARYGTGMPGTATTPTQPGQAVGTYQMMDDVVRLIDGQSFGLGAVISPVKVGNIRTLYNTKIGTDGISILMAEISTTYTRTAHRDEPGSPARPILPGVEGADQAAAAELRHIAVQYMLGGSAAPEHVLIDDIVPDELMLAALDDLHLLGYWAT